MDFLIQVERVDLYCFFLRQAALCSPKVELGYCKRPVQRLPHDIQSLAELVDFFHLKDALLHGELD